MSIAARYAPRQSLLTQASQMLNALHDAGFETELPAHHPTYPGMKGAFLPLSGIHAPVATLLKAVAKHADPVSHVEHVNDKIGLFFNPNLVEPPVHAMRAELEKMGDRLLQCTHPHNDLMALPGAPAAEKPARSRVDQHPDMEFDLCSFMTQLCPATLMYVLPIDDKDVFVDREGVRHTNRHLKPAEILEQYIAAHPGGALQSVTQLLPASAVIETSALMDALHQLGAAPSAAKSH